MILWLASYPRSGNTMLRMMLHKVFGCKTYTRHFSRKQAREWNPNIPRPTGATPLRGEWDECYGPMSRAETTYLVKTHAKPEDNAKTIYIVRNGFAATRSYQSYLRDFNGLEYSLEQVILGEPQFQSWGRHLDAWNPLERPNTLVLKYEDLVERPDEELERIVEFTGFQRQAEWVNEFEKLHASHPKMYRQGHVGDPQAEFSEEQVQLFWAMHGDWMVKLRYGHRLSGTQRTLREGGSGRLQTAGVAISQLKPWWRKLEERLADCFFAVRRSVGMASGARQKRVNLWQKRWSQRQLD